ncbi:MAG: YggS family pyridoxal phosphate-dependent enzyme [Gammaproteobacteria bacterium]|jgi:pyridoxal phosphate enzyme (YggS family)|nr:YggS family pyridoxal phosphate-dependent enzyme [Gammaproteobacteria bacterium]
MNQDSYQTLPERLAAVRARIGAAETRFGRTPGSVRLLAVSKKQEAAAIRAAHDAGQLAFGENYLQEALAKQADLDDLPLEWHFIGQLQTNKTRPIAEHFAWVHGLTSAHHAERLSRQRPPDLPPLKVCLEINISGEATKGGVLPDQAVELLAACRQLPNLELVGLMCLPAPAVGEAAQRQPFRALRELRDRLARPDCPLSVLSMGMSDDLEAAIAEGATLVRVGTAIFGPRL